MQLDKIQIDLRKPVFLNFPEINIFDKWLPGNQAVQIISKAKHDYCIITNSKPRRGQKQNETLSNRITGVSGEIAVAIYFDLKINAILSRDDIDIGGVEIRSTEHFNGHLLGFREEKHKLNRTYIFCIVPKNSDFVYLIGWAYGFELLIEKNWADHFRQNRPCFALSQKKLWPMRFLRSENQKIIIDPEQKRDFNHARKRNPKVGG